jgi:hypothetical protein
MFACSWKFNRVKMKNTTRGSQRCLQRFSKILGEWNTVNSIDPMGPICFLSLTKQKMTTAVAHQRSSFKMLNPVEVPISPKYLNSIL